MRINLLSVTNCIPQTFSRRFLGIGYVHAFLAADPGIGGRCEIHHALFDYDETAWSEVAERILEGDPDLVGFACYVWNGPVVLEIARLIKSMRPDVTIVLGGPEVSHG